MKILVTNNTLNEIGGSETYAYAVIDELNKRDNVSVVGYSPNIGFIGNLLRNKNVTIVNSLDMYDDSYFDLILASHTSTINAIKRFRGCKIQTCHGIYPPLEQPVFGMNSYVSISEEVYYHLARNGINSTIIHNGVDCNRFFPKTRINERPKKILSLAQSDELNYMLKNVCDKMNIEFIALNKFINPVFDVENIINGVDLVISLGRGVYESMACGRNVLILDKRPYINRPPIGDGLIMDSNIDLYLKNNCSGRFTNKVFTEIDVENEINKYSQVYGDFCREYAVKNFNIEKQLDKYISLI